MQMQWEEWLRSCPDLCPVEVSSNAKEIVFEVESIQYKITSPIEALSIPWKFHILYKSDLNDKIETWINNVNEDFEGKPNDDPPK